MRIGLLAGQSLTDFQIRVLEPILEDSSIDVGLVVVDDRAPTSFGSKIKSHWKRGRGGYILVMAWKRFFHRERTQDTEEYFRESGIPILKVTQPYSEETLASIREHGLDLLVLIGGFGIVRKPMLDVTPGGVLSYHHGDMRKYRGLPPGFWEVYHGEKEMGVTVQRLSPELDAGLPIVEKKIPIRSGESWARLTERAYRESEGMMHEALCKVRDGLGEPEPIGDLGPVYTLPNLRQWLRMHVRVLMRRIEVRKG